MDEKQELYNRVRTLTRKANSRMNTLEKKFGHDTYAVKILKNKLSTNKICLVSYYFTKLKKKLKLLAQAPSISPSIHYQLL